MEIQCMDLRSQYTEKEVINYEALHGYPHSIRISRYHSQQYLDNL